MTSKADDALLEFTENLRRSAVQPNIRGYRPHDAQAQFHASTAKGRLFIGGNRSGKTVGGAAEAVRASMGIDPHGKFPPPPLRGRVSCVDALQGIGKICLPEIVRWLPPSALINGSIEDSYQKTARTLTLSNGSFIEFMTYQQEVEQHAGANRHWVWFDEEPGQAIFNEDVARLVDTDGSWWMTMTPVNGMTWIYDDIFQPITQGGKDLPIDIIRVWSTRNPYISQSALQSLMLGFSEEERAARTKGDFAEIGGKIYPNFGPHNLIQGDWVPPASWLKVEAMDSGLRHPTAWLFAAINPKGQIFVYDEHYQAGLVVRQTALAILARRRANGFQPAYVVGDPAIANREPVTGTSVQQEYIEWGIPIALGNNDVPGGLNRVRTYLGLEDVPPKLFIVEDKCPHLVDELKRYRYKQWANRKDNLTKAKPEEPHKKDDHACDALRYLVVSRPEMDTGEPEHTATAPLDSSFSLPANVDRFADSWDPSDQATWHSILGSEW